MFPTTLEPKSVMIMILCQYQICKDNQNNLPKKKETTFIDGCINFTHQPERVGMPKTIAL
jgi:hypothetical protein